MTHLSFLCSLQISPSLKLSSALPPLPLYDQPPISPFTSPETSTPPPLPRSPSATLNGEHKPQPPHSSSHKGPPPPHSKNTHTNTPGQEERTDRTDLSFSFPLCVDQSCGKAAVSPGFPQPLRFTPEGAPNKLRPVSFNPPPRCSCF